MTKDELFEIFDKYDTYEFRKEGESIHGIKWADLNGLAEDLVKLFSIHNVVGRYSQKEIEAAYNKGLEDGYACVPSNL